MQAHNSNLYVVVCITYRSIQYVPVLLLVLQLYLTYGSMCNVYYLRDMPYAGLNRLVVKGVCFLVTRRDSRLFSFLFRTRCVYYGKSKKTNLLLCRVARKHYYSGRV